MERFNESKDDDERNELQEQLEKNNKRIKASSLSDALPSYHLCLQLWLHYLMTGKCQYDDAYVFMDEEEIIVNHPYNVR